MSKLSPLVQVFAEAVQHQQAADLAWAFSRQGGDPLAGIATLDKRYVRLKEAIASGQGVGVAAAQLGSCLAALLLVGDDAKLNQLEMFEGEEGGDEDELEPTEASVKLACEGVVHDLLPDLDPKDDRDRYRNAVVLVAMKSLGTRERKTLGKALGYSEGTIVGATLKIEERGGIDPEFLASAEPWTADLLGQAVGA